MPPHFEFLGNKDQLLEREDSPPPPLEELTESEGSEDGYLDDPYVWAENPLYEGGSSPPHPTAVASEVTVPPPGANTTSSSGSSVLTPLEVFTGHFTGADHLVGTAPPPHPATPVNGQSPWLLVGPPGQLASASQASAFVHLEQLVGILGVSAEVEVEDDTAQVTLLEFSLDGRPWVRLRIGDTGTVVDAENLWAATTNLEKTV